MFGKGIRTAGCCMVIAAWLLAAAHSSAALDVACIGCGLLVGGIIWPAFERLFFLTTESLINLLSNNGKTMMRSIPLFQRNKVNEPSEEATKA